MADTFALVFGFIWSFLATLMNFYPIRFFVSAVGTTFAAILTMFIPYYVMYIVLGFACWFKDIDVPFIPDFSENPDIWSQVCRSQIFVERAMLHRIAMWIATATGVSSGSS